MNAVSFFRNRWIRRLLWTAVTLAMLFLVASQWINWRSARRLQTTLTEFENAGETLDFRSVLPAPVPEARNFCAVPALMNLGDNEKGKAARERLENLVMAKASTDDAPPIPRGPLFGEKADLTAWARHLSGNKTIPASGAAGRIIGEMESDAELVQSLLDDLDRTDAEWTPAWKTRELPEMLFEIELPQYQPLMALSKTLALLTLAEIELGHADRAHQLLLTQLRIVRASLREPFLIGSLVGAAQLDFACRCIWEFARLRLGSSDQFQSLRNELAGIDLKSVLLQAYRTELIGGVNALMNVKKNPNIMHDLSAEGNDSVERRLERLLPRLSFWSGFIDSNIATMIELEHAHLIRPLREGAPIRNSGIDSLHDFFSEGAKWYRPDQLIARIAIPSAGTLVARFAVSEGTLQLASTACRLEAHFAKHGSYPESFAELPSGMRYERTAERYRLWLPGPDGEDDGGKRMLDPEKPENTSFHADDYQGDWVWDYPGGRD